jgi:hypothetical protein
MAATSVTSVTGEYIHRISKDSTYDIDMDWTENIVNAFKNKKDYILQFTVYSYYLSTVYSYFIQTKKYIFEGKVLEDLENDARFDRHFIFDSDYEDSLNEIKNNFNGSITVRFDQLVENATTNFNKSKIFYPQDFMEIFYFISNILCLSSLTKILNDTYTDILKDEELLGDLDQYENEIDPTVLYPLSNVSGLFSINCYLYALFEGIYLIGVPISAAHYDGNFGCSRRFIEHDVVHTSVIIINSRKIKYFKKLYIAILSHQGFSSLEKELHILTLWYVIHEEVASILFYDKTGFKGINDIEMMNTFAKEFLPEFKRFLSFSSITDETFYMLHKDIFTKKIISKGFKQIKLGDLHNPKSKFYRLLLAYGSFYYSWKIISSTFSDLISDLIERYNIEMEEN